MGLKGRWTAENRTALEAMLANEYRHPPIAVFDWDYTSVYGDTADMVFHALCRDSAFRFESNEFAKWVQEIPVPTRIMDCVEKFHSRATPETRAGLRFEIERTRWALHESEDDNQAWAWDSGAFVGWTPAEVREYTRRVVAEELAQPLHDEYLTHAAQMHAAQLHTERTGAAMADWDLSGLDYLERAKRMRLMEPEADMTLTLKRGLRLRDEMRELMSQMRRAGWQVFVLTASPQWEIEAFAERYAVPPQNVIGMRRAIVDGRITADIEPPCSWGDGKLDAFNQFVTRERPPTFAAGDSVGDWKLLEWAECALLVQAQDDPTQASPLKEYALLNRERGENWLVQALPA